MRREIYPYTNTSLEDLKNEIWEDIPFLDGAYLVSNFGRVKRVKREVYASDDKIMHFPERIIRSYPDVQKNKSVNDEIYHLAASVTIEKKRYKFSIPRLVFYCFVDKFPLDDYSLVVYAKDGNGKNIKPSNLRLTDLSGKAKRIFERGRLKKDIETTYDEYLRTGSTRSSNPYCKQVSQYTSEGKFIKTFPSIRTASRVTGATERGIISVLKGRQIRSSGNVWSYRKQKHVDVKAIRRTNIERRNRMVGKRVTQYDLNGKRVAIYYTIAEAGRKTKVNTSDIHAVLNGKQRSAGGYVWKKGFGKSMINVKGYLTGEAWRSKRRQKKITKYNLKGKAIKEFESVKQAAKEERVSGGYISMAVKKQLIIRGFQWRFS